MSSIRHVRNTRGTTILLSSFLCAALLLAFGCGPSSSRDAAGQDPSPTASNSQPELTDEVIHERINDAYVREVPEENGAAEPISWRFNEDEPKEIVVVEKQIEGALATVILDIKTRSGPNWRNPRSLSGQIRTEWRLKTGWVLRRWEIVDTENISMKYKNLPKPPEQKSENR